MYREKTSSYVIRFHPQRTICWKACATEEQNPRAIDLSHAQTWKVREADRRWEIDLAKALLITLMGQL